MDPRLYTLDYLDTLVLSPRAQLWHSGNAALVTELKVYPTGALAICVVIAAGDKGEIVNELRPRAEQWARNSGCRFVIVESRHGWGRELKPHGYAPFQTALMKEL